MVHDIKLIETVGILFERKIILYGASVEGERTLQFLQSAGVTIYAFADSDPKKWNTVFNGNRILSFDELKKLDETSKIAIIISSMYDVEICELLNKFMIATEFTFSLFGLKLAIHLGILDSSIDESFREKYLFLYKLWRKEQISSYYTHFICSGITTQKVADFLDKDVVLIYQPGKVGSSSIYYSVLNSGFEAMHVHDMAYYFQSCSGNELDLECFQSLMKKKKGKIKIITLVREPISRDVSMFFQLFAARNPLLINGMVTQNLYQSCINIIQSWSNRSVPDSQRKDLFIWTDYLAINKKYGAEFDWFELEMKKVFKIDILQYPFDRQKGYSIIIDTNIEVLLMKYERLSKLEHVIAGFLTLEKFELCRDNVSSEKDYKYVYQELIENIKYPKSYVDFYYKHNKYMDYFYTQEEKDNFLQNIKIDLSR